MSNTLILTQDQVALVKSLHVKRADGQEINLSANVISLLSKMPADLLQPDRKSGPALEKGQIRFFILMITHAFRLLIIMQSVDKNCLDSDENPSQKTSLHQMLRKYALFETVFPKSKRLVDSLKGDVLWFSH